jgi:hypothetical protein
MNSGYFLIFIVASLLLLPLIFVFWVFVTSHFLVAPFIVKNYETSLDGLRFLVDEKINVVQTGIQPESIPNHSHLERTRTEQTLEDDEDIFDSFAEVTSSNDNIKQIRELVSQKIPQFSHLLLYSSWLMWAPFLLVKSKANRRKLKATTISIARVQFLFIWLVCSCRS